jgi:hypothetical protein
MAPADSETYGNGDAGDIADSSAKTEPESQRNPASVCRTDGNAEAIADGELGASAACDPNPKPGCPAERYRTCNADAETGSVIRGSCAAKQSLRQRNPGEKCDARRNAETE